MASRSNARRNRGLRHRSRVSGLGSRVSVSARPIGVFDSGLGGLTVVRQLARVLPKEDVIYLGDLARLPYGPKSDREIIRYSEQAVTFLKRQGIKFLVIACNSVSSIAYPELKKRFTLPMVGVIAPCVEEAFLATRAGRVGVIGTQATIRSRAYAKIMTRHDSRMRVFSKACPLFVSLVEEGWLNGTVTTRVARKYLMSLKRRGIDTLILGCTHYPPLAPTIRRVLGRGVRLIMSGDATAERVKHMLAERGLLRMGRHTGSIRCFVTDAPERFRVLGQRFLGPVIKRRVRSIREVRIDV
ncbi:MAG: glutamate racemase [Candidatus Omnitrophica bacterium]|nr:glutamate racemase [Candidatus Omnitrophota bacterium]